VHGLNSVRRPAPFLTRLNSPISNAFACPHVVPYLHEEGGSRRTGTLLCTIARSKFLIQMRRVGGHALCE
jgi:hypothetical protein